MTTYEYERPSLISGLGGISWSKTGGHPSPAYLMTVLHTRRAWLSSLGPGQDTVGCPERTRRALACTCEINSVGREDSCRVRGKGGSVDGGGWAIGARGIEGVVTAGRETTALLGDDGGVPSQAAGCTARWTVRNSV